MYADYIDQLVYRNVKDPPIHSSHGVNMVTVLSAECDAAYAHNICVLITGTSLLGTSIDDITRLFKVSFMDSLEKNY